MNVRPLGPSDIGSLCGLVDADCLPGQPVCTEAMASSVLAGRSRVDHWWWEQVVAMRVVAVEANGGELVGAGAIGRRTNGWRYLLWLHAKENRQVLDTVVVNLLRGVRRVSPTFAFWFASDLSVGLEGLPRQGRSITHDVLVARGFVGHDRWLYLRASEPSSPPEMEFRRRGLAGEMRVELVCGTGSVGGAELSVPVPGLGVLWWLEVEPEHRRRGYGRQLLRAARQVLVEAGATETILFVDHDDPAERDRRPALELYLSEGFTVVDHLWSYHRGEVPPEERSGRGA